MTSGTTSDSDKNCTLQGAFLRSFFYAKNFHEGMVNTMRLTVDEYNELMLELQTSVNYFEDLRVRVETVEDANLLYDAIQALDKLATNLHSTERV